MDFFYNTLEALGIDIFQNMSCFTIVIIDERVKNYSKMID